MNRRYHFLPRSESLKRRARILAFHPTKNLLLVCECGLDAPDNPKLSNLLERAQHLKESMDMEVRPVLFSRFGTIPQGTQDATITSIVDIVGPDKLNEMFDMASSGKSVDEIVSRTFNLIGI